MVQRGLDVLIAISGLIVLSPLLVPVIIALRFTGEGEIFFRQERVGKGRRPFALLKFATMLKNSPNMATGTVTVTADPRILPLGRFLRRTKINEIPQLLNILKGDMSLIGPRPQTWRCFDVFPAASQEAIVQVKPGLSGAGSIVFRREEDLYAGQDDPEGFYDGVIMPYKGRLEEWYVDQRGLRTYVLMIAVTAWVLISPASSVFWWVFPGAPRPPDELRSKL